jgi:uncharacterized protein
MRTVSFGKLGFDVSRLGFGMMRLPVRQEGDKHVIDRGEAIRMLRTAIDSGVNYVDTAYGYHDGESEIVTGIALKDGYRDKVKLTTKLPQWLVHSHADMDRLLDEQLRKLDVCYLDFYLLHSLSRDAFARLQNLGYKDFLDRAKRDGRIRHAGFSFHDDEAAFRDIIDDYPWEMAQVQFNYLDDEAQATVRGIHYAAARGIPVVDMEPLRGGALCNPPGEVRAAMDSHPLRLSPVEWAFRYVADMPEIVTILSGMSTMDQVQDNLRIFAHLEPGCMSAADKEFTAKLKAIFQSRMPINCTHCNYCQPCPQDVKIPDIFGIYNDSKMFDHPQSLINQYGWQVKRGTDASRCVECGACEAACPQKLPVMSLLKQVHSEYEQGK